MTGGMAFVYDKEGSLTCKNKFRRRILSTADDKLLGKIFMFLKIKKHFNLTNSNHAKNLINNWNKAKYLFWQIAPKEMISKFKKPVLIEEIQRA